MSKYLPSIQESKRIQEESVTKSLTGIIAKISERLTSLSKRVTDEVALIKSEIEARKLIADIRFEEIQKFGTSTTKAFYALRLSAQTALDKLGNDIRSLDQRIRKLEDTAPTQDSIVDRNRERVTGPNGFCNDSICRNQNSVAHYFGPGCRFYVSK